MLTIDVQETTASIFVCKNHGTQNGDWWLIRRKHKH